MMSRGGWSSFKKQQSLHEGWFHFLKEEIDGSRLIAGINSEEYPDSLLNVLQSLIPNVITQEQADQLIAMALKMMQNDGVVLEAVGSPPSDPRTFSVESTAALEKLIDNFKLTSANQKKLEQTLDKWARMNTVKFTSIDRAAAASVAQDEEPQTEPTTATPESDPATAEDEWTPPEPIEFPDDPIETGDGDDEWAELIPRLAPEEDPLAEPEPEEEERDPEKDAAWDAQQHEALATFLEHSPEFKPIVKYAQQSWAQGIKNSPDFVQLLWGFSELAESGGGMQLREDGGYITMLGTGPPPGGLHPGDYKQIERDTTADERKSLWAVSNAMVQIYRNWYPEQPYPPTAVYYDPRPMPDLKESILQHWHLIAGITKKVL